MRRALFILSLFACIPGHSQPGDPLQQADPREIIAEAFVDRGDLQQALLHWKILKTLYPHVPFYHRRIEQLQQQIREQSAQRFAEADKALREQDPALAQRLLMNVLAIDPSNQQALLRLRGLERERMLKLQRENLARLQRKIDKKDQSVASVKHSHYFEAGVELFKAQRFDDAINELEQFIYLNPNNTQANDYLFRAHWQNAALLQQNGDMQQSLYHLQRALVYAGGEQAAQVKEQVARRKQELADLYYNKGLQYYLKDMNKAVDMWRSALDLNPGMMEAKIRLEKAVHAQKNLQQMDTPW